jgi:hypothetical protein
VVDLLAIFRQPSGTDEIGIDNAALWRPARVRAKPLIEFVGDPLYAGQFAIAGGR